jgi:hypothetical protein
VSSKLPKPLHEQLIDGEMAQSVCYQVRRSTPPGLGKPSFFSSSIFLPFSKITQLNLPNLVFLCFFHLPDLFENRTIFLTNCWQFFVTTFWQLFENLLTSYFQAIPVKAILSIHFSSSPFVVAAGHRIIQFLLKVSFPVGIGHLIHFIGLNENGE